jgi:hypothetical protein
MVIGKIYSDNLFLYINYFKFIMCWKVGAKNWL